jgi:RNA 3'-terminal phosphate cyclase
MTIEIGIGSATSFAKLGDGYIFDPEFDLRRNRTYFGAPRLEAGLYSIRVVTAGGTSNVLEDVIAARRFAEEYKTLSVRGKFSTKWATGPRILRGA